MRARPLTDRVLKKYFKIIVDENVDEIKFDNIAVHSDIRVISFNN